MAWMTAFNWLPFVASVEFSSTLPAARLVRVRFKSWPLLALSALVPMLHVELAEPPATVYEILEIFIDDVDIAVDVVLSTPSAILLLSVAFAASPMAIPLFPVAFVNIPMAKLF